MAFDLSSIFKEFRLAAVWASDIGQYWYCACKILHAQTYGQEETAEMNEGKARHEAESEADFQSILDKGLRPIRVEIKTVKDLLENNLRNLAIIKEDIVLSDNRDHRSYYGAINYDPPIVGVPDAIGMVERGWLVIYEKKRKLAPNGEPYFGQRMQLATYLMTLEQVGIMKCFGVVYTEERPRKAPMESRVYLNDIDKSNVLSAARAIRDIRSLKVKPMPTPNPNKCVPCQYGPNQTNVCRFSPLLLNQS